MPGTPRRHDGDPTTQYAAIVWRGTDLTTMQKFWFDDAVDALATAVSYLKAGFQARLSDGAVAYFSRLPDREQIVPLPSFDEAPVPRFSAGAS